MRNAGAGVPKGPRLSRCPRAHPPFAPSGVLVSHDILPRAARMFSLSLSFPFDFWKSLRPVRAPVLCPREPGLVWAWEPVKMRRLTPVLPRGQAALLLAPLVTGRGRSSQRGSRQSAWAGLWPWDLGVWRGHASPRGVQSVSAKRAGSRVALSSINQARGLVPGLGDTAHCVIAD